MARIGKIARLPDHLREELNQRLRNGEAGPQILPWLNAQPEAVVVCTAFFESKPIDAQNLSAWRLGGFSDWQAKHDRTARIKELAKFAAELATANNSSIARGASAIASGRMLEVLEAATGGEDDKLSVEEVRDITASLCALRGSETAEKRADLDEQKIRQKDEEIALAREKFQRDTAAAVLASAKDAAVQQIASAPLDHAAQLEAVGKHLFGDLWK